MEYSQSNQRESATFDINSALDTERVLGEQADWNSISDKALIERLKAGDQRAFEVLDKTYRKRLCGAVSSFVADPSDAEDLVQEVFIKAWRAIDNFRGDAKLFTWLYQIAINTGLNHARRKRPSVELETDDIVSNHNPETSLAEERKTEAVHEAMQKLAEPLQQALALNVLQGHDYETVSKVLGCPLGTVRSRVSRARAAIAEDVLELH